MKNVGLFVLSALLLIGGCASKKPSQTQDSSTSGADELVLNGDSDSNKAGKIRTIYFPYNEVTLDSKAKSQLAANADYLKANTAITVQVEGHCDERGSRQYNLALGERRAKAVKDYLKAMGVKADRIETMSWGNEKPVSDGNSEDAWSQNRRANFVIIAK